jgi:hypothetical protein
MTDETLKIWLGFFRFVVGTAGVSIVTLLANHQIQMREVEIKEQEQVGTFLESALPEDVGARYRFAQYFSNVTRSDQMRGRWKEYRDEVEKEFNELRSKLRANDEKEAALKAQNPVPVSREIEVLAAESEALRDQLAPTHTVRRPLGARIYVHVASPEARAQAETISDQIAVDTGAIVPSVELVRSGPNVNELRYFKETEREEATMLANAITKRGVVVVAKYFPGYEGSTRLRARHYELWLKK